MPTSTSNKWAVLIGIEYYDHPGQSAKTPRKNNEGNLIEFKALEGCVNDVLRVEEYLRNTIKVPASNIKKLLRARPEREPLPAGTSYEDPTYQNIVNRLREWGRSTQIDHNHEDKPKSGDFVYIHFSGHGALTSTIFPELKKGRELVDEALVPCDITMGGHYLRDLEIAALLENMVAKDLVVTVVFDCCHSGGAIRGEDDDESKTGLTRGIDDFYVSDLDIDKCQEQALVDHWVKVKPGWIDNVKGFVALTACMSLQKAKETRYHPRHGLLTDRLLRCLRNSYVDMPSQALFGRIRAEVQNINSFQTPDLKGDPERFFFGKDVRWQPCAHRVRDCTYAVRTLARELQKLDLEGGALHGVEKGDGYDILRKDVDLSQPINEEDVLAMVRVTSVYNAHSEAQFRYIRGQEIRWEEIEVGCPATVNSVSFKKKTQVRFLSQDDDALAKFKSDWQHECGDQIWLELADAKALNAFFTVSVNAAGNLSIDEPTRMISPAFELELEPLPWKGNNSVSNLISRLEHLGKFKVTRALSSVGTPTGSIAASLSWKVSHFDEDTEINGKYYPPAPEESCKPRKDGVREIKEGEAARLTLSNISDRPLHVVVMCWSAELEVTKIYPVGSTHRTIEPGKSADIPFVHTVAPELRTAAGKGDTIMELLKVFVMESEVLLSPLELPSLKKMEHLGLSRGGEIDSWKSLGGMLADLDVTRGIQASDGQEKIEEEKKPKPWGVVDIEVRVIPRNGSSHRDDLGPDEDPKPRKFRRG